MEKGSRVALRLTTQTITATHPMDYRDSTTPQQRMQARTEECGAWWKRDKEARDILLHQMQSLRQRALSTTPRDRTAESVRHTL